MKKNVFGLAISIFLIPVIVVACSQSKENKSPEPEPEPEPEEFAYVQGGVVDKFGKLSVKGISLVDKDGNAVALRGVSFGWHNWWPRFYNEKTVSWLVQDWKCNLVRAAIGVEPSGAYITDPDAAMKCLYDVIDAAIDNNAYVIVDWHSHNILTEEAKSFFTQVAEKYKSYPNIIYEIFNEPEIISWQEVKEYSIEIVKTIRSIDKDNIILVGSPHWCQDIHLAADDPITGYDNLMYTMHFYASSHKQSLRDRCDYAIGKGLPLFVSECAGMEASGDGPINRSEWNAWTKWMKDNKVSWAAWSVSDKNETCSMVKSINSPVSNWTDNDLKDWGVIVRAELKK